MEVFNGYKVPDYCKPRIELLKKHREELTRDDYCSATFRRCASVECPECLFGNKTANEEQFIKWRDLERTTGDEYGVP